MTPHMGVIGGGVEVICLWKRYFCSWKDKPAQAGRKISVASSWPLVGSPHPLNHHSLVQMVAFS